MEQEYVEKINFVKELSDAVSKVQHNVNNMHYDVFVDESDRAVFEYLVIEYRGGAKTVRNCYADSCSAIFDEIAKYLNSGYYSEIETYKKICEDSRYTKLEI